MSEEIVMSIYYEFKLRQVFREAADNKDDIIGDERTWNLLLAYLIKKKLASIKDVELLERYRPSFPLEFDTFIKTITQAFGDRSLKRLEINIDDSKEQLENCRTLINLMNIKLLSKEELYQLANIIFQCNKKSIQSEKALQKILKDIHGYSEDVFGFVWDKIYGVDQLQIKLPHHYVKQEKAALEKEFNARREIAYCADKDFPVENFKIPKEFPYYDVLTQFFNQIGATKELLFSKYLPSYLGFDDFSDDHYNQYFFEIKKGKKIKQEMTELGKTLLGYDKLFKYWSKELLYAFRDITYKSTYNLLEDISLKNVFVSDVGIKLYLKKIKFGQQRDDTYDYHLQIESQMLRMYAKLLIEMLTNREDFIDFDNLEIDPELKCILYECYHAQDKTALREQQRYESEINQFIQKETEKTYHQEKLNKNRDDFAQKVEEEKKKQSEQEKTKSSSDNVRTKKRKPDVPQANRRNFEEENQRMGVRNELDLLMGETKDNYDIAKGKQDKGLIQYTQDIGEVRKERQERYLTIQGLLNHPYFIAINEADISIIIDEFEKLMQPIVPTANERSSYHNPPSSNSSQDKKCDSCRYRVPINECTTFKCKDCGSYIICDYCYQDYMEKSGTYSQDTQDENFSNLQSAMKKIQCVYCWSRHTLTDICVKTLKSLGFPAQKGSTKILINTLSKDKVKKLTNLRVIQKTLVYVIGIAPEIATEEILKQPDYFGQYGDLIKVVVNTNNVYNATRGGPSYSAYLTFSEARESAIAILSVDQFVLHDRMLRASFGTSKFCQFFLNGQKCTNKDCLYLHELRSDLEAYTKEDMSNNKFIFQEQQKIAIKLSKALEFTLEEFQTFNKQNNKNLLNNPTLKPILPSPDTIYHKDFHFLDEPLINRKVIPQSDSQLSLQKDDLQLQLTNQKDEINQSDKETSLSRKLNKNLTTDLENEVPKSNGFEKPAYKKLEEEEVKEKATNGEKQTQQQQQIFDYLEEEKPQNKDIFVEEEKEKQNQITVNGQRQDKQQVNNDHKFVYVQKKKIKKTIVIEKDSKDEQQQVQSNDVNIQSPKDTTKRILENETEEQLVPSKQENSKQDQEIMQQIQNNPFFQTLQHSSSANYNQVLINKKSENSTLSKTPPHNEHQLAIQAAVASYLLSPMIFRKKQESRFQFAHSVDPIKSCDWDEIEVPAKIQDLIERNIRTLSNSISNKSENGSGFFMGGAIDLNELKERWLTKKEEFLLKNERNTAPNMQSLDSPRNRALNNTQSIQVKNQANIEKVVDQNAPNEESQNNPITKLKVKKPVDQAVIQTEQQNKGGYNLKEHSVNIRIKYNRQPSKDNKIDVEDQQQQSQNQQNSSSQQQNLTLNNQQQQQQQMNIDEGKSSSSHSSQANSKSYRTVTQQNTNNNNKQRRRKHEIRAADYRKVNE